MIRSGVLHAARWLVIAYAVAQLALTVAGVALFPRYAETHLDSDALAPNAAWTAPQTQAALQELGWPATTIGWITLSRSIVGLLVVYPVLFLLLSRQANSGFAVFAALVFAVNGPLGGVGFLPLYDYWPGLAAAGDVVGAIGWQLFFVLFYFFPDGRAAPRWTRWLGWAWGILIIMQVVDYGWVARLGDVQSQIINWVFIGLVLIAIGSQVYRYFWRSDPVQREQTKWVMYVLALGAAVIALTISVSFRPPNPAQLGLDLVVATGLWYLFGLIFALVPAAIGVAILRYRLWDIDVVIRRTLIYAVLTGLLALAYLGTVLVLQSIFSALTGQSQSTLVTVLSTLAIAALFGPLRVRVQSVIDRRLYRRKYDAARTLTAFGAALRDETNLDHLTAHLTDVVDETMQPLSIGLWLPTERDRSSGPGRQG